MREKKERERESEEITIIYERVLQGHQSRTVILLFARVLTTEVDDKLTTIIEREMER